MAVMTEKLRGHLLQYGIAMEEEQQPARKIHIRPIMVASVSPMLAGMGLVVLMVLGLAPLTFLTAFLAFALAIAGGIMTLVFCGEI